MNRLFFAALFALPVIAMVAGCRRDDPANSQKWTCVMHPQYISDKPGDCPICNMKLVPQKSDGAPPSSSAKADKPKIAFYRSPMNPSITSPTPRKDEMGMDYVPVYAGDTSVSGFSTVDIDPQQQRLIGLKTVEAQRGTLAGTIRTTGRIAFDEQRLYKVTARFSGYVEKLHADFTGKFVKKGEPLLSIYSPDLLATEEEYLLTLKSQSKLAQTGLPDVAQSARDRLRLFGIGASEIDAIAKSGKATRAMTLYAPVSGFITAKTAVAGGKVAPDDPLFEIADLSRVWILADVYEYELPRLRLGQAATLTLSYWPDKRWRGRVSYIFPTVDEQTRTVKVRIEVDNSKTDLKPEMFGDVLIETTARTAVLVPEDAVIDSGTRKLVFVALGEGRLQPREVQVGLHAEGKYEIRSGLHEGDHVASGASFLLDSESRLKSAVSAMAPAGDGGAP
jgi:RND family efflux transporter MFP subunit